MNAKSDFPCPNVSRFKGYESPIDGKWISSAREREQDLNRSNSYDPRDVPREKLVKGREVQKADMNGRHTEQQLDFWRKPDDEPTV